jgi:hypothetical protein
MSANDTLARLREAALKSSAGAAAQAPATPAPTPAAAQPAPTPPAALPQAAQAASPAPAPAPVPAASTAVTTSQASAPPSKAFTPAEAVSSDEEALAMIRLLHGNPEEGAKAVSVSDLYDETNANVGVSFSHPFAQVSKGYYKTLAKHCPKEFLEFMPDGQRPFNMVYLGYRIGATSWAGTFGDGKPPAFKFAIPSLRVNPDATEMIRQLLAISTKIQFKKVHESKYMTPSLGKLTPEIHIFGWKLTTGFICLSNSGHKAVELTAESLDATENVEIDGQVVMVNGEPKKKLVIEPMKVVQFTITENITINPKKPIDDPKRKWSDYPIIASIVPKKDVIPGSETAALKAQWENFFGPNIRTIANQGAAFSMASDFKGLSLDEIKGKLAQYNTALV